ncbi:MAG TPA: RluA family pseudouridine synthase [Candidatus Paceibacterota bacterium]
MNIDILYEDKDIMAINKPSGLVVHGDGRTKEPTLTDWILKKYPKIKNVGESGRDSSDGEIDRSGIVHRLDRETSGVMLVAKNQKSFENLKKQFQEHKIKKIYHCFVFGEMKAKPSDRKAVQDGRPTQTESGFRGTIDRPIGRSAKDFRLKSAQRGAKGEMREAVTDYKVLSRGKGYSFVEVMPKTGRTHQIRVHFKAINYPLVADSLYAPNRENSLGFQRTALHSYQITFADLKGKSHTLTAPYPEDFEKGLKLQN